MKNRTNINATSRYDIDDVRIFETDVTAVVDWERDGDVMEWQIVAFILEACSGKRKTARIDPKHPLFDPILEGVNGKWLEGQLIKIDEIRRENNR